MSYNHSILIYFLSTAFSTSPPVTCFIARAPELIYPPFLGRVFNGHFALVILLAAEKKATDLKNSFSSHGYLYFLKPFFECPMQECHVVKVGKKPNPELLVIQLH